MDPNPDLFASGDLDPANQLGLGTDLKIESFFLLLKHALKSIR